MHVVTKQLLFVVVIASSLVMQTPSQATTLSESEQRVANVDDAISELINRYTKLIFPKRGRRSKDKNRHPDALSNLRTDLFNVLASYGHPRATIEQVNALIMGHTFEEVFPTKDKPSTPLPTVINETGHSVLLFPTRKVIDELITGLSNWSEMTGHSIARMPTESDHVWFNRVLSLYVQLVDVFPEPNESMVKFMEDNLELGNRTMGSRPWEVTLTGEKLSQLNKIHQLVGHERNTTAIARIIETMRSQMARRPPKNHSATLHHGNGRRKIFSHLPNKK